MWRHDGFVNPYRNDWFTSYNDCLTQIIKLLELNNWGEDIDESKNPPIKCKIFGLPMQDWQKLNSE